MLPLTGGVAFTFNPYVEDETCYMFCAWFTVQFFLVICTQELPLHTALYTFYKIVYIIDIILLIDLAIIEDLAVFTPELSVKKLTETRNFQRPDSGLTCRGTVSAQKFTAVHQFDGNWDRV